MITQPQNIPDILFDYLKIIAQFASPANGLTLDPDKADGKRQRLHEALLDHYCINRGDSLSVTDNLDRYDYDPEAVHMALAAMRLRSLDDKEHMPHCVQCGTPKHVTFIRLMSVKEAELRSVVEGTSLFACKIHGDSILVHPKHGRYGSRWG